MDFSVHNPQRNVRCWRRQTQNFHPVNALDLVLLLPLLLGAYSGWKKGLILEVFGLLALAGGIYGGIHFSDEVATWMQDSLEWDSEYLHVVAFAVTFIGIVVAVHFLARALSKVAKMAALGWLNRAAGALFSMAKVLLITSIVLWTLHGLDDKFKLVPDELKAESALYGLYMETALTVMPALQNTRLYEQFEDWRRQRERKTMPWEKALEAYAPKSATSPSMRDSSSAISAA